MKTKGAETKNKNINWRVCLTSGDEVIYKNLKELCIDQDINRTNVYRLANGVSKPTRKKNIRSIEKIYLDTIND